MRRSFVLQIATLTILAGGCSPGVGASPSVSASVALTVESALPMASASVPERVPLPSPFPVPPGAVPVAMSTEDPALIGLWSSDMLGAAAYDFYAAALPNAGYPIVGLYPGGSAAMIRFSVPGGTIWQLVVHDGGDATVAIEIRLDRP